MADREILLGVGGGIAAYKAADLTSKLVQSGLNVTVVLTKGAEQFIAPTTFEALTGRPVYGELFTPHQHHRGAHIGLAEHASLMVIAPATADLMAKFAHGLADDLLSTLSLTVTAPILLAPAMNTQMWEKPSVQRNLSQLRQDGYHVVEPGSGWLSCGQVGAGRMAEPAQILQHVQELLASPR